MAFDAEKNKAMRRHLHDEAGFTLIELVVVITITVLLMGGLSTIFVSGLRASDTTNSTLASQTNIHIALDRLEYETRCASQAALVSSGTGVTLTLPTAPVACPHASGTVSWCVTSGSLEHYTTSGCSGTGQVLATSVTSTAPFSCIATVGDYPELQIALAVNAGTTSATAISATDQITLRNAALTTSTSAACS